MRVFALRSGSSGNAILVQSGTHTLLIDAGVGPRILGAELRRLGVRSLDAILITHEHHDHIKDLELLLKYHETVVVANPPTMRYLPVSPNDRYPLPVGGAIEFGELLVRSFAVPHDAVAPTGYWLEDGQSRVCIATDLGQVPGEMLEYMQAADLVVLESNYDPHMLEQGPYPLMLKHRIQGDRGHLSNMQAGQALLDTAGRFRDVWLAHLSVTNNHPDVAYTSVTGCLERAGVNNTRVQVAARTRASLEWYGPERARPGKLEL